MRIPAAVLILASLTASGCEVEKSGASPDPAKARASGSTSPPSPSATVSPTPSASPASSPPPSPSPAATGITSPRTLAAILLELEELENTGVTFDPEVDARLTERPEELLEEAAALGVRRLKPALEALIAAQSLPLEPGYLKRRPFLCRLVARLAHHDPTRVGKELDGLPPLDVKRIAQAVPQAHRGVVGGWFRSRSRLAKNTGGGAGKPEVRRALLEGYGTAKPDDPTLSAARTDPDPGVQALGRKLTKRD